MGLDAGDGQGAPESTRLTSGLDGIMILDATVNLRHRGAEDIGKTRMGPVPSDPVVHSGDTGDSKGATSGSFFCGVDKMWIRIETNVLDNDKVFGFAEVLGISVEEIGGHLLRLWGKIAEHRTNGDLAGISNQLLSEWARWRGQPQAFGVEFRKSFMDGDMVSGWPGRQGKLIAHAEADRARKFRGRSAENPSLQYSTVQYSSDSKKKEGA